MTSEQWKALADRCGKAKGPSSGIDKAIILALGFSWRGMGYWDDATSTVHLKGPFELTRSLDAITALIERALPGVRIHLVTGDNYSSAQISKGYGGNLIWLPIPNERDDNEIALALCQAFCLAMSATSEKESANVE